MNLSKSVFIILILFNINSFNTKLTPEQINKKNIPNWEEVKNFFNSNKIFQEFLKNLNKSQQDCWLGHSEDLIQELFEGLASLKQHAANADQASIDLVANNTLNKLFGTSWQAYFN